jgi:hypothetical protein
MKTKLFIFAQLFLIIITVKVIAQEAVSTPENIAKFYETTTCIVLNDDIFNTYNTRIKDAVEQNWTITDYEFVSMADYSKRNSNPEYSFLIPTRLMFDDEGTQASYSFLSVVLSDISQNLNTMPDLCSFPLSYYDVDYDKYDYKLPAILLFMQNHINLTRDNPDLDSKNIIQYYNKNTESMSGKTLYIIKEELAEDVNTLSEIKEYYSGPVKIVTMEEIEEAIENNEEDVIFLHKVGPPEDSDDKARCFKLILGADDGKLYYFDYHKINDKNPDGLLKSDFKKMK